VRIAITGTRNVDLAMPKRIAEALEAYDPSEDQIITGAAIGVDAIAAREASNMGFDVTTIVPSERGQVEPSWRTWADRAIELPPSREPYRDRNEMMVGMADRVLAFVEYPEQHPRSKRSGTWMTIRIARRQGKHVILDVMPHDGED
jgi:predicted Rossmann fold nucleotide-binding protein DprA/Smf involved in DNA uptake